MFYAWKEELITHTELFRQNLRTFTKKVLQKSQEANTNFVICKSKSQRATNIWLCSLSQFPEWRLLVEGITDEVEKKKESLMVKIV